MKTKISYQVYSARVEIALDDNIITKLLSAMNLTGQNLPNVLIDIMNGDSILLKDKTVKKAIKVDESELRFVEDEPILARRKAFSYARSLADVLRQTGEQWIYKEVQELETEFDAEEALRWIMLMNPQFKFFTVVVFLMDGEGNAFHVNTDIPFDTTIIENQEKEYSLYKERGLNVKEEVRYIPELERICSFIKDQSNQ